MIRKPLWKFSSYTPFSLQTPGAAISSTVSRPPTSPAAKESDPRRRGSWTTELNPTKGAARTSRDDEEDQALEDELCMG
ncbi:uncharacterized protein N7525_008785 [Penicillium rubens]|uniref:uncharacterized protein n=1 Tax=Penicillium rubens TaxID=1108849 RepID=UPI002A59986A|nr:uncharacterized protein N7525_008785 [Penicillium rubens]KAJ5830532.1 hypothetical protein N7525_008785 [Penicillium rubens]